MRNSITRQWVALCAYQSGAFTAVLHFSLLQHFMYWKAHKQRINLEGL